MNMKKQKFNIGDKVYALKRPFVSNGSYSLVSGTIVGVTYKNNEYKYTVESSSPYVDGEFYELDVSYKMEDIRALFYTTMERVTRNFEKTCKELKENENNG